MCRNCCLGLRLEALWIRPRPTIGVISYLWLGNLWLVVRLGYFSLILPLLIEGVHNFDSLFELKLSIKQFSLILFPNYCYNMVILKVFLFLQPWKCWLQLWHSSFIPPNITRIDLIIALFPFLVVVIDLQSIPQGIDRLSLAPGAPVEIISPIFVYPNFYFTCLFYSDHIVVWVAQSLVFIQLFIAIQGFMQDVDELVGGYFLLILHEIW